MEVQAKAVRDQMGVLKDVHKSIYGSAVTGKKKTPSDLDKLELEGTEKLVSEAKAEYLKAVLKPFDLVRQLLIGEARTQWEKVVTEMFDRDSLTGVNGKTTITGHVWAYSTTTSPICPRSTTARRQCPPR